MSGCQGIAELSACEIDQISGGPLPLIAAALFAEVSFSDGGVATAFALGTAVGGIGALAFNFL